MSTPEYPRVDSYTCLKVPVTRLEAVSPTEVDPPPSPSQLTLCTDFPVYMVYILQGVLSSCIVVFTLITR